MTGFQPNLGGLFPGGGIVVRNQRALASPWQQSRKLTLTVNNSPFDLGRVSLSAVSSTSR